MVDNLELQLVRAWRRYAEHLAGKHNQKSHANRFGSPAALKANVKRLGKDKEALKKMAKKVRGDKDFQARVKAGAEKKRDAKPSQMRGTEKQVAWAKDIVSKADKSIDGKIDRAKSRFESMKTQNLPADIMRREKIMRDAVVEAGRATKKELRKLDDAGFVINNRGEIKVRALTRALAIDGGDDKAKDAVRALIEIRENKSKRDLINFLVN